MTFKIRLGWKLDGHANANTSIKHNVYFCVTNFGAQLNMSIRLFSGTLKLKYQQMKIYMFNQGTDLGEYNQMSADIYYIGIRYTLYIYVIKSICF